MADFRERRYAAQDGRSLYYREYGDPRLSRTPLLCLPGLSRNSHDFHDLAFSYGQTRRVVCPDYRGRGRSDYDPDPAMYHPRVLLDDLRHLLVACGLHKFVVIGTSMGGLLATGIGAVAPSTLRGVILNDIGPEIGDSGVGRILEYIGRDHPQKDWHGAITALKTMLPGLNLKTEGEWRRAAEGTFREGTDGRLHIDWDPKIVKPMRTRAPSSELWRLFRSLSSVPMLAFRGETSTVLSAKTFERMAAAHRNFVAVTIAGTGHTPSLGEPEARTAIDQYLQKVDGR